MAAAVPPELLRLGVADWKCSIAFERCGRDVAEAANLLLERSEETDDWWRERAPQPVVPPPVAAVPRGLLETGFPEWKCQIALAQCAGDLNAAANFLYSHEHEPDGWWH